MARRNTFGARGARHVLSTHLRCEVLEERRLLTFVADGPVATVNDASSVAQTFSEDAQNAIAVSPRGAAFVVWKSNNSENPTDVGGRMFAANGAPLGDEFVIADTTAGNEYNPSVAVGRDGIYAVVWASSGPSGVVNGVFLKRFDVDGTPLGVATLVSDLDNRNSSMPVVDIGPDGSVVVAWVSGIRGTTTWELRARVIGADGVAFSPSVLLASGTSRDFGPSVVVLPDERFALSYRFGGQYRVQQFNQLVQPLAEETIVGSSDYLVMDADGQGRLWLASAAAGTQLKLFRIDAAGELEFVSAHGLVGGDSPREPSLAVHPNGRMALAWHFTSHVSGLSTVLQELDAAGQALGAAFQTDASSRVQRNPSVAMDDAGNATLVWNWVNDVRLQRFRQSDQTFSPMVSEVRTTDGNILVREGARLAMRPANVTVHFSQPMSIDGGSAGAASVTNPSNWRLIHNGADVSHLITEVAYVEDAGERAFRTALTFGEALPDGVFRLVARDALESAFGTTLDGDIDGIAGGDFSIQFLIATPVLSGDEFRINQTTASEQRTSPASLMNIAMRGDGTFVTTWASLNQDGSGWGVYARVFDANSQPLTGEILANQFTAGDQRFSTVAMEANGDFVVTWTSDGQDGDGYGIYARRFRSGGTPLGNAFRVNEMTAGLQGRSSVAMDDDGDFVIAWESKGQDGFGYGVYARRYTAGGQATGGEFLVNQTVLSDQRLAGVAMTPSGEYVVTWTSFNQDGSGDGIFARRYDNGTDPRGDEFRVNTTTGSTQRFSRVAMDRGGDFVITWMSNLQDGDGYGIYAQRYRRDGAPDGNEFRVNQTTSADQLHPVIDLDDVGDFVIAWASASQDGDDIGIYARRYSPGGVAQGDEFRVNTTTFGQQNLPSVALDAEGDFTIVWNSLGQDGDGFGVFAQRYGSNSGPTADAGGPYQIQEGAAVFLSAGGSSDPDQGDVLTVTWDLNGDGVFGDAAGATPTVTWAQLSTLGINDGAVTWDNLRVRVTDSAGNVDEADTSLAVVNVVPTIALAGAAQVQEGAAYSLTLGAITDPGADTVSSWTVHWGDGTSDTYASGGQKSHIFVNGPATNTMRVDLTDEDGTFVNAGVFQVTVTNVAPLLQNLAVESIDENGIAVVRGSVVEPGADTFTLQIYWGDSPTPETIQLPAGTTSFEFPHQYIDDPAGPPPDEYPIDVILRDSDAGQDTDSLRVTVRNIAPAATVLGLEAENPIGELVSLSASVVDPGPNDTFTYGWTARRNGQLFASGNNAAFAFTPDLEADYLVELKVTDDDGGVDTTSVTVHVPGGAVPGDTNGDGEVNIIDLNNVRNNFGGTGLGDTNQDGIVNIVDLNAVRNNFGAGSAAPMTAGSSPTLPTRYRSREGSPPFESSRAMAELAWLRAWEELASVPWSFPTLGRGRSAPRIR